MASCKTYFLCTLYKFTLIHIGLYSLLLFHKIIKFKQTLAVTCIHLGCKCTKRRWHQSSQKYMCNGKNSCQAPWMRAAVMWGKFAYFPHLPQPVPPPPRTPNPKSQGRIDTLPQVTLSTFWQLSWLPMRQVLKLNDLIGGCKHSKFTWTRVAIN